ncbi:efflux RND transporter permease subunit [Pseudohongiella spirulinae]|uniref:SSD domain-containing protein n=1 Tax=Pseudohongiella spirulinae TaxID=1249552 RepID=A0A0S2KFZ8_9GAMM|nr:MMPL family transporter [Pseudohongiella spirulinae]ALO47260.1 hypothetical protein PS2015_2628 [Pseudohongiella spirulinae]
MFEFLVRQRNLLLLGSVCLTLFLAAGIRHADFDTRIEILLGDNDPFIAERDLLNQRFQEPQQINIAVTAAQADISVFSPPVLNALGDMHFAYRQIPYAKSASSVVAFDSPYGEIGLIAGRFRNFESVNPEILQNARERAMNNQLIGRTMVSADEVVALFSITLSLTDTTTEQNREIASSLTRLIDELHTNHPGVRFFGSGEAMYEMSTRAAMLQDLIYLLPWVILICILFICYCFKSVRHGASILIVTLLTVASTVGTLAWSGTAFNSISVMAPLVVVIIAVANTAHLLSIFRQQRRNGTAPEEAMQQSLNLNLRPVTLAALTTTIGFLSLNYASSPAISQFGSIVASGVTYAWCYAFLAFPALVLMTDSGNIEKQDSIAFAGRFLTACRHLRQFYPRTIFLGTIAAGTIAALLLPLNQTDFDRTDFIDQDSQLHQYFELLARHMGRGNVISWGVEIHDIEVSDPATLHELDRLAEWLRSRDDVTAVVSLADVIKTINQTLEGNRYDSPEQAFRIPADQSTIDQHLMNYLSVQRDSYALDRFLHDASSTVRLFVTTGPLSNQQIIDLDTALADHINRSGLSDTFRLLHGSDTVLFARMDKTVTVELIISYAISLTMITLVLTLGLRSVRLGLISVAANLLPATLVFGAWAILVGQIDPFVMMLFSISIGLVVDDTVHLISHFQRQREGGADIDTACEEAAQLAGPALTITTAVLALGTFILLFASTLYFQQAATLLVPIVVLALLLDLTFLPLLLKRADGLRLTAIPPT